MMRLKIICCYLVFLSQTSFAQQANRLIVLADMGNEPDEMQQMIHLMACSNEFEIEGLIAVTGLFLHPDSWLGEYNQVTHPELFIEILDVYAAVYANLKLHGSGWQDPVILKSKVATGQSGYGIGDIGKGKSSAGSELIINALNRKDNRPIWLVVNAGANTLAQALFDYQERYSESELKAAIAKLRVFENGAQDNSGAWICKNFPGIHWIRSNYQTYAYGGPYRNNLGPNFWQPFESSTKGQLDWQKEHIMNDHGALGGLYPERLFHAWGDGVINYMEGGGTIPWMGLVNKGLFDINHPSWGGWSGRFTVEKHANFWSRHKAVKEDEQEFAPFYTYREANDRWVDDRNGQVYHNNFTPIWRWREAMYNDMICRMDWCVKPYTEANHHPIANVNGDKTNEIIFIEAIPGQKLSFDASGSEDPDGDAIDVLWWQYLEAGTYPAFAPIADVEDFKAEMTIPYDAGGKQIHLILEVKDRSDIAPLFDYRRIVINVN